MLRPIILSRSLRQFGVMLSAYDRPNDGIGPRLRIGAGVGLDNYVRPTVVVGAEPMELTISGIRMKFVHAPSEADDQLYVWLLDKKCYYVAMEMIFVCI